MQSSLPYTAIATSTCLLFGIRNSASQNISSAKPGNIRAKGGGTLDSICGNPATLPIVAPVSARARCGPVDRYRLHDKQVTLCLSYGQSLRAPS